MEADSTNALAVAAWKAVMGDLQLQVTASTYETWLKDTIGLTIDDDILLVGVSNPFAVEWLERRIYPLIRRTVQKITGRQWDVRFLVNSSEAFEQSEEAPGQDIHPLGNTTRHSLGHTLNQKYTFDRFVVGPSNRLPFSAAQAVADAPGTSYNPLFLYSGVGLGKTHLLHAIGHTCASQGLGLLYVTCEHFTNEFIAAIKSRTTEEFRARYRSADVLLIDDVQFISGKEQTQEGFFHTFNDLHNSNRQLVLTSDRSPKAMPLLEDRLRSRFGWGLIADLQPPDLETRIAILRTKAEQMEVSLEYSIVEFLAKKVRSNVRELEGSLNRLVAMSQMTNTQISLDLASQAIQDFAMGSSHRSISADRILDQVANQFRVRQEDLVGQSRKKDIVRARHVAMYLLHMEMGMKDTDIGRLLGGRAHSTVIHAIERMNRNIDVDTYLNRDVLAIKESLFD